MIFLNFICLISLAIIQIKVNNDHKKLILSQTGLPISQYLDIPKKFLTYEENVFICVSTECSICQKIIVDFCEKSKSNYYLLFFEKREIVDKLINNLNIDIEKERVIYEYQEEKLYLSVTPFVYITNNEGVIIDKKVIDRIEQIND